MCAYDRWVYIFRLHVDAYHCWENLWNFCWISIHIFIPHLNKYCKFTYLKMIKLSGRVFFVLCSELELLSLLHFNCVPITWNFSDFFRRKVKINRINHHYAIRTHNLLLQHFIIISFIHLLIFFKSVDKKIEVNKRRWEVKECTNIILYNYIYCDDRTNERTNDSIQYYEMNRLFYFSMQ